MGAAKKLSNKTSMKGVADLRQELLHAVAEGSFDEAVELLKDFLEQPSPYPQFRKKMERLVSHCVDLVNAIRAKKSFPGMKSLTRSKQHDLAQRSNEHYSELQLTLLRMDRALLKMQNEDIRSTLWTVRAVVYSVSVVVLLAFFLEFWGGLWKVLEVLADHWLEKAISWVMSHL